MSIAINEDSNSAGYGHPVDPGNVGGRLLSDGADSNGARIVSALVPNVDVITPGANSKTGPGAECNVVRASGSERKGGLAYRCVAITGALGQCLITHRSVIRRSG